VTFSEKCAIPWLCWLSPAPTPAGGHKVHPYGQGNRSPFLQAFVHHQEDGHEAWPTDEEELIRGGSPFLGCRRF